MNDRMHANGPTQLFYKYMWMDEWDTNTDRERVRVRESERERERGIDPEYTFERKRESEKNEKIIEKVTDPYTAIHPIFFSFPISRLNSCRHHLHIHE